MQDVLRRLERTPGAPDLAGLVRVSAPVPGLEPESLLGLAAGRPRGFWKARGCWAAFVGSAARLQVEPTGQVGSSPVGVERPDEATSAEIDRYDRVRREASAVLRGLEQTTVSVSPSGNGSAPRFLTRPRFYGGFSFHPAHRPTGAWAGIPAARFDLPAAELRGDGEATWLSVVLPARAGSDGEETAAAARRRWKRLRRSLEEAAARPARIGDVGTLSGGKDGPPSGYAIRGRRRVVEPERWRAGVERALRAVDGGELRKVVLARALDLELERAPDPGDLVCRLRRAYPASYPFLFEFGSSRAFLGAAPEPLGIRRGSHFETAAVAGTIAGGSTPEENERLARRLLASRKNRSEHLIGVEDLTERLARLADATEVDAEPHVFRIQGMQHLETNISARLTRPVHILDLVRLLHPTAAVNGYPRDAARQFLLEEEPFQRGWYAGPVGWFDLDGDGEFAPGLRSAVIQGARLRLFAGAGLVPGSRAGQEWDETEMKLRPILDLLEGTSRTRAAE